MHIETEKKERLREVVLIMIFFPRVLQKFSNVSEIVIFTDIVRTVNDVT